MGAEGMSSIVMMVAMIAIFYFLLIRPENKRKKKAEEMRNSIKKGDTITTIGGIVGKIVRVTDENIVIETSEDRVRMELAKWAVSTNTPAAAAKKEEKAVEVPEEPAEIEAPAEETKE